MFLFLFNSALPIEYKSAGKPYGKKQKKKKPEKGDEIIVRVNEPRPGRLHIDYYYLSSYYYYDPCLFSRPL